MELVHMALNLILVSPLLKGPLSSLEQEKILLNGMRQKKSMDKFKLDKQIIRTIELLFPLLQSLRPTNLVSFRRVQ